MYAHRAQVGEGAELAAQAQQPGLGPHECIRRRPLRSPDCTEQHRIGVTTARERRRRQRVAVGLDGGAAEGEGMERDVVPERLSRRREAARGLTDDFGADAIAGEHRDARFHARRS